MPQPRRPDPSPTEPVHPALAYHEVVQPEIAARDLADYMAASETGKRAILRESKYRPAFPILHYDLARRIASGVLAGGGHPGLLAGEAACLRARAAAGDEGRDLLERNAEYLERLAAVQEGLALPEAERLPPGLPLEMDLHGVRVPVEMHLRLRRVARGNQARIGGAMLRYRRGRPVPAEAALWQSALLLGCLRARPPAEDGEPEGRLCLTIDAWAGTAHAAPSDAVRRWQHMLSACATIAELWPGIRPPAQAAA